jgi:tRNA U38,U39,U40 pseudouridine synthase TruA
MVRRIVGVLAAVGRGEIRAASVLDPGIDVAALTAPAAGLFLEGVYYKGEPGPTEVRPVINLD